MTMRCCHCDADNDQAVQICTACGREPISSRDETKTVAAKKPNPFSGRALNQMRLRSLFNSSLGGQSVVLRGRDESDS
jgi:hypothetical protein